MKEDLLNTPFGGRYCGGISPRLRISLYSTIIISFYTDYVNTSTSLFNGTYKFINDCECYVVRMSARIYCGSKNGVEVTLIVVSW